MTPRETKRPASGKAETAETAPVRMRDKRFDGYLKGAGIVLATICAVLPFVMYYDILDARPKPQASGKNVRDPLNRTNQKVVRETHSTQMLAQARTGEGVDPMTTATTAELTGDRRQRIAEANKQPFPGKPRFLVREVVGDLVMIEDESGYWFVEKGSPLPDGSTLIAIERGTDPGSFSIKTSEGGVFTRTN